MGGGQEEVNTALPPVFDFTDFREVYTTYKLFGKV
jgi:hypothetical protein